MSIKFDEKNKVFFLNTKNTEYQIKINEYGMLIHSYYGGSVGYTDMSFLIKYLDRGFSSNPFESRGNRGLSADTLPSEYSTYGAADFRVSALMTVAENGSRTCDLRYIGHEITNEKYKIEGLPYVRGEKDKVDTLRIDLLDDHIGIRVSLYYGVFEEKDIITRHTAITNVSDADIYITKAASMCMDIPYGDCDMIHFHGRHAMERLTERTALTHDIHVVGSRRGMSSHHNNPFVIICDRDATEISGNCYGVMLMYSGNHKEEIEVDQANSIRVVSGIGDDDFNWKLAGGGSFDTPEAILAFSAEGLNTLSFLYHRIIRENVCPAAFRDVKRPVLLNNWEGTYFDFDEKKIMEIEDGAAQIGCEMLVLDDGWFGVRNSDNAGLGDWKVNLKKLPGGLKAVADHANSLGMKFGLWFEPEMVNEDSDLYRSHPDWVLMDPGRKPVMGRNQMVLDMSNKEVVDYLFESIKSVLTGANIEYVKWDFNRSMSNVYSKAHSAAEQQEITHRFILGTYDLLTRLTTAFPNVMFEGCAGGGGRFDAGMMFFSPQIWCSDNTDAINRLKIQKGTSYGYPVSTVGSHISASPNHQNGREVPIATRAIVAMSGTFGYELDPAKLTDGEKESIRSQIKAYNRFYELIGKGRYFRLSSERDEAYFSSWEFASEDGKEALVNIVVTDVRANAEVLFVKLHGLRPEAEYTADYVYSSVEELNNKTPDLVCTGASLMNGGLSIGPLYGVYPSIQLHLNEKR